MPDTVAEVLKCADEVVAAHDFVSASWNATDPTVQQMRLLAVPTAIKNLHDALRALRAAASQAEGV